MCALLGALRSKIMHCLVVLTVFPPSLVTRQSVSFFVGQSIAVLFVSFFSLMTQQIWVEDFWVEREFAKVNMLTELCVPSLLMKPWPGRNVTPQWSEGELELVPPCTLSGCSGIADSPLLIPRRQHFLAHLLPWTVLGVRFFVKLEALPFSFRSLSS